MLNQLSEKKAVLSQNSFDMAESIKVYFNNTRRALEQREKALLSTTYKYFDIKLSRLDAHYSAVEQHRSATVDQVAAIEKLIEDNDNVVLLQEKQSVSEELEVHQQSIVSICDMLSESQQSSLTFRENDAVLQKMKSVGTISEYSRSSDAAVVCVKQVMVSEEEDPYTVVPLRFEDLPIDTPQKEVRFDLVEYEPENKPIKTFNLYDTPKRITVPEIPPRSSSSSEKLVQVFHSRVRNDNQVSEPESNPALANTSRLYDVPKRIERPHIPPRSTGVSPKQTVQPHCSPKPNDKQEHEPERNLYDTPKPLAALEVPPRGSSTSLQNVDEYCKPRAKYGDYDIPPHKYPKPACATYDIPKSSTLPSRPFLKDFSQSKSYPQLKLLSQGEERLSSSDDEYEPLDDIIPPTPTPRNIPPPLPPNHPSSVFGPRNPKPIPKPRKRSGTEATPGILSSEKRKLKHRSNTLPVTPALGNGSTIVPPVMVIDTDLLSSAFGQESVYPVGICCIHDNLIITDVFNHCIRIIDRSGTFLQKIGKEGRSGGQFKEPSAVAIDSSNHIYVTERDNPRVQKFTATGKYVSKFGQKTLLGNQLSDPLGVAISKNGCVAVSDWDKGHILFFAKNGKVVNTFGRDSDIKFPAGITFDSDGNLYVADRGNHCLWVLSPNGDVIRKIGSRGSKFGELYFPYGIAVKNDRIMVSESGNHRVSVFSLTGNFVSSFGKYGSEPGMFDHPRHICINSKGELLVADEMNQRVQIFQVYH